MREVIAELQADATPEEILLELRRLRIGTAQRFQVAQRMRDYRSVVSCAISGTLLNVGLRFGILWRQYRADIVEPVHAHLINFAPNYNFQVRDHTPDGTLIRLFSEIPDNHPIQVDGQDLGSAMDLGQETGGSNAWTVVKHQGKIFLKGYLYENMSPLAVKKGPVTLYGGTPAELNYDASGNDFLFHPRVSSCKRIKYP